MRVDDTDRWVAKYKMSGAADKWIADKLGLTVGEVQRRWIRLQEETQRQLCNGYNVLSDQFTIFAHQYVLLGESLKTISAALSDTMPDDQLRALVSSDVEQTIKNLRERAIVLKPYVPPFDLPPPPEDPLNRN